MARGSNGLRLSSGLLLGFDELQWAQDEVHERIATFRAASAWECGWVGDYVGLGTNNLGWMISDAGGGSLEVATDAGGVDLFVGLTRAPGVPLLGVDPAGRLLELRAGVLLEEDGTVLTVPNDGTWYTLIAHYGVETYEPGTLSLTAGSTTITGTDTQFLRYGDSTERPSLVRIDATDTGEGNEGSYQIATITDDTSMTVVTAPPATEAAVRFRVKGQFQAGEPANPDIHYKPRVYWEVVTRTTTRPVSGLIAYDVRNSGGTITTIDRRRGSRYRRHTGDVAGYAMAPLGLHYNHTAAPSSSGDGDVGRWSRNSTIRPVSASASVNVRFLGLSLAPCASGSHLTGLTDQATGMMVAACYDDNTADRKIVVYHHTVAAQASGFVSVWDDPDAGSLVTVVSAPGLLDVDLVALPANSGYTHAIFYVDTNGSVIMRRSTDNGATWSSATTIWNPAGAETVARAAVVLTRMNRLIVVGTYSTGDRVRYVVSDDLGDTWDNNTQAGYGYAAAANAMADISIVEDDRGNLWTATVRSSTARVELFRGQAEGNPVPSASEQSAGWQVGPDEDTKFVDVFPLPNGILGIITTSQNTRRDCRVVMVARRNILHHQLLVYDTNGAAGDFDSPCAVGVAASGVVYVAYGSKEAGGGTYDLDIHVHQWAATRLDRAHTWYGGQ